MNFKMQRLSIVVFLLLYVFAAMGAPVLYGIYSGGSSRLSPMVTCNCGCQGEMMKCCCKHSSELIFTTCSTGNSSIDQLGIFFTPGQFRNSNIIFGPDPSVNVVTSQVESKILKGIIPLIFHPPHS